MIKVKRGIKEIPEHRENKAFRVFKVFRVRKAILEHKDFKA